MATVERPARHTKRRRTVIFSVGCALFVLFLVAGFVFANTVSVSRVTENAMALHWNNSAVGTSALARAGLVQAITFAQLEGEGIVAGHDFGFALEQAVVSHEELEYLVSVGEAHQLSFPALARFSGDVGSVLEALQSDEVDEARELVISDVEPAYLDLTGALATEQTEIQGAIEDNRAAGRSLNAWVVFIMTLAVPGSAVAVYFVVAQRQMRTARQRMNLELEAEREVGRAKDSFIAGLSHELRAPLTSIYGFAEVLCDGLVSGPEATKETAGSIAKEAAEMTRMVDDLLVASRLAGNGLEVEVAPVRVSEVVESAVVAFERAGIRVERDPGNVVALADAARLRHVLINLLSNAARHGGPNIEIEVTDGDRYVDIEVIDNGPDVDEERISKLFESFAHRGDQPLLMGPVGLGLAISERITRLMDGTLRYQRYLGKTYFILSLPTAPGVAEADDDLSVASMIKALSS